jgi:hypothetical protein
LKDLKTVLETLNSDTVCLPDGIVKAMLYESGLMTLVLAKGNMEKHELGYRVTTLGMRLVDASRDDAVMHDMFTMKQYRDILLAEAELIQFVMEYRKKLGDEANKDFDWSSMEKKDDKPKIVGKVDLTNGI